MRLIKRAMSSVMGVVLGLTLLSASMLPATVQAAFPEYTAYVESSNSVRINIRNADAFSQIDFYARQGGNLSTTITNLGQTDRSGRYSGSINPGLSFSQGTVDTYVTVNGVQSAIIPLGTATIQPIYASQNHVSLTWGGSSNSTATVYLYGAPSSRTFFVNRHPSSAIATANLSGNVLNIRARGAGSSSVQVCSQANDGLSCVNITISVDQGQTNALYANGTLVLDNGTLYIIYRNTKTGFTNYPAFIGLGYQANQAISANISHIPWSGRYVGTSQQAHPLGTWIKNGNTVYFVSNAGLIPITSHNIFLNNGGQDRFIVPANVYDFQLPILSVMTRNDSRVR